MKDSTADAMNDALDFLNDSMEVIHDVDRMTYAQRLDSLFCGEVDDRVVEIVDEIWVKGVEQESAAGRTYSTGGKDHHLSKALLDADFTTGSALPSSYTNSELRELDELYENDQRIQLFECSSGDGLYDPDETGSRERTLETLAWHYVTYGEDAKVALNGYCAKDYVLDIVDQEGNGNVEWLGFVAKVRDDLEL